MLGIRLTADDEAQLARHARDVGRPKSAVARDWIKERLVREHVDCLIRDAVRLHAAQAGSSEADFDIISASVAHIRRLDAEDGGYDWGADGPPPAR